MNNGLPEPAARHRLRQKSTTYKTSTATETYFAAALLLLILLPVFAEAMVLETYHYSKTVGSKKNLVEWKLEKQNLLKLTWQAPDETVVTWHDPSLAALRWFISRPAEQTCVVAERAGNTLLINGRLKGRVVEKKLTIDSLPWYQALSVSLRPFVLSNNDFLECWTLRPDTLRVYKIRVSKLSVDTLTLNGRSVKARKVKLNLTGILALLGASYYWFRTDDGVFMKFAGPAALSGKRQIIIEFIEN